MVLSPQTLSEEDRRTVAAWAADCAERVLLLFEREAPGNDVPRDAIGRARAFSRGELDAAGEIRRRFEAGRASKAASTAAGAAAARSAAQAAAVAHMGAHALGAAAFAATARVLAAPDDPGALEAEVRQQLGLLTSDAHAALLRLPRLLEDGSGPLGPGLLATGSRGEAIRLIQTSLLAR